MFASQKSNPSHVSRVFPPIPHPHAPYGAQGVEDMVMIWHHHEPKKVFENPFQTAITVVDWTHDGNVVLAGSITGEVLAWRLDTGERLLANRHAHSYAPIVGVSCSPGGAYVVAITMAQTIQIWRVETRTCLVLPCHGKTTTITWERDGSGFRTNDGVDWSIPMEGRS
ncbi:MAG: WD40 repeat domain-containing protein [Ktedonobacteraceae bacterium]|nr:WD40 repeat domain-containing protein [Ktedonobacteraceae bacterium]